MEADAQDDGHLEVHEILGLRLNAKLVTLSACDTALGSGYFSEVPAGDDLVGLTRAFLFAGSPESLGSKRLFGSPLDAEFLWSAKTNG